MTTSGTSQQFGKYQIIEELGRGGFATVYRARDITLDRDVALKILHPQLLTDSVFVQRFRQEARTLATLRHPNIVTIYEVSEIEGRLFIAAELAHGSSLAQLIVAREHLPWDETLALLRPICTALDYAHGRGIIHRDLKPANILLDAERGPLLTDFGFARLMEASSVSLSLSGGVAGTPGYIAPEVWEQNIATAHVDVYALGCIVYELLVGQVLFAGQTPIQVMRAHDRGPQMPETWPEGVPPEITAVLHKALAHEPANRYQSAGALWYALKDVELEARSSQEATTVMDVAAEWRREVETAMSDGDWSIARMALGRWLAMTPDDPDALAAKARLDQATTTFAGGAETEPLPVLERREHTQPTDRVTLTQPRRRSVLAWTLVSLLVLTMGIGGVVASGVIDPTRTSSSLGLPTDSSTSAVIERPTAGENVDEGLSTQNDSAELKLTTTSSALASTSNVTNTPPPVDTLSPVDTPPPVDTPLPTSTFTATPIPEPRCSVATSGLNLRTGPNTLFPSRRGLSSGTSLKPLAKAPGEQWFKVVVEESGEEGWVGSRFVQCEHVDLGSLPVDPGPPLPSPTNTPLPSPTNTPLPPPTNTPLQPTLTPTSPPPPTPTYTPQPFLVTGVTMRAPVSTSATCPSQVIFSAEIAVNQAGKVTYQWEYSDGVKSTTRTVTFSSAGSQLVEEARPGNQGDTAQRAAAVRILSPNALVSDPISYTLNCSAPAPRQARVTVTFTRIDIHDDADSGFNGDGEMWLDLRVNNSSGRWPGSGNKGIEDDKSYTIDQSISVNLYENQELAIYAKGTEDDDSSGNDNMGSVDKRYPNSQSWSTKGSESARSTCNDGCYTIHYTIKVNWLN
jgi:eukaryotic-like serine/threonine-protein kinase